MAQSKRFPCVIATNRDEFFDRPAAPLAWWSPDPVRSGSIGLGAGPQRLLGGRDLIAGGTWLGLSAAGGFALVTNLREPAVFDPQLPSRGDLVQQALAIATDDDAALAALASVPRNGFNLLRLDLAGSGGAWVGNHPPRLRRFGAGVHGLSNAALDTPWPKVRQLKARLRRAVDDADDLQALLDRCFGALTDPAPAADAELPDTHIGIDRERLLSPAFIRIPARLIAGGAVGRRGAYGTRCSTVVVVQPATDSDGAEPRGDNLEAVVVERRYAESGAVAGETRVTLALAQSGRPIANAGRRRTLPQS